MQNRDAKQRVKYNFLISFPRVVNFGLTIDSFI